MKKEITWVLILFLFTFSAKAQDAAKPERNEKINALRVAFLTEKMDLNSAESAQFWPIYNQMKKELESIRKEFRPAKKPERMNEEEALDFMRSQFEMETRQLDLKRQYHDRFIAVLPAAKLVMLRPAETEFNRMVLNRVKKQMQPPNRKRNMN